METTMKSLVAGAALMTLVVGSVWLTEHVNYLKIPFTSVVAYQTR